MTFTKDPDAVLDYSVDWSLWLAGDQISTSEWLLEEGALLQQVTESNTTGWLRAWRNRAASFPSEFHPCR